MSRLFDVQGKTAVITGGGGVLCGELARALAGEGARVAVLDYNAEAARKVAGEIREKGGTALAVQVNVLEKEDLVSAKELILKEFGKIDILINGAGGNHPQATTTREHFSREDLEEVNSAVQTFFTLDPEAVQSVFNLNFLGTFLPGKILGEVMAAQGGGVILNVSSMSALRTLTKVPAYSAAKAAVSNFTQWLAVYFAPAGIRVNAIAPGFFLTEQNRFLLTDRETGGLTERGKKIIDHTPMGRFGNPEDLVGTVLWLVSDASNFVTGIVVPVDGGFSAFSGV
ncbi:MAG: SDR family oxidoreductase [Firmicutes bacterium]|nr:SDR family oxidoreductase [Bacillota bacterium]